MQIRFATLLFTILICSLLCDNSAIAQGIRIVDCQGRTKAFRQYKEPTNSNIKVDVVNAEGQQFADGEILLTNANGEIIKAVVNEGIAEFTEVRSGVWMVSSPNQGLFFTQISLSDFVATPFWSSLSKTAEIALVVGAAVGTAILINDISDGSGSSGGSTAPPSGSDCMTCNPDIAAPSIPDFD